MLRKQDIRTADVSSRQDARLRARARRARAQPEERRRRHPARRAGGVHRRLRARASRRWPSARCTPRRSGATSSRCRPTRGGCSTRWPCRRWTRSTACRRRWPCSSSAARRPRAPRSAASPRSRTCCACCTRAPATIRRASRSSTPSRSRPTRRRARARAATGLGRVYEVTEQSMVPDDSLDDPRARHRRLAARLARAEPARHPGHAGLRRRHALARAAEEGPRLDPVHRRAADGAGLRRLRRRRRRDGR